MRACARACVRVRLRARVVLPTSHPIFTQASKCLCVAGNDLNQPAITLAIATSLGPNLARPAGARMFCCGATWNCEPQSLQPILTAVLFDGPCLKITTQQRIATKQQSNKASYSRMSGHIRRTQHKHQHPNLLRSIYIYILREDAT